MSKKTFIKKGHLVISAIVVILAGLIYGCNPSTILPKVFGFDVHNLELKNIFRAIMGLYLALGIFWLIAIKKPSLWKTATICNIIFMGGLAFGRLISLIIDGLSVQFTIGMLLEFMMMLWGMYNLKASNN